MYQKELTSNTVFFLKIFSSHNQKRGRMFSFPFPICVNHSLELINDSRRDRVITGEFDSVRFSIGFFLFSSVYLEIQDKNIFV